MKEVTLFDIPSLDMIYYVFQLLFQLYDFCLMLQYIHCIIMHSVQYYHTILSKYLTFFTENLYSYLILIVFLYFPSHPLSLPSLPLSLSLPSLPLSLSLSLSLSPSLSSDEVAEGSDNDSRQCDSEKENVDSAPPTPTQKPDSTPFHPVVKSVNNSGQSTIKTPGKHIKRSTTRKTRYVVCHACVYMYNQLINTLNMISLFQCCHHHGNNCLVEMYLLHMYIVSICITIVTLTQHITIVSGGCVF